jgi:hypothetical protein
LDDFIGNIGMLAQQVGPRLPLRDTSHVSSKSALQAYKAIEQKHACMSDQQQKNYSMLLLRRGSLRLC